MATERSSHRSTATLRVVVPSEATSQGDWTGRVGALSASVRPELLQRPVRLVAYAVFGALIGVLLLVGTATVPVLFGYHTYVVNGGSMEPSLRAGSVAVTAPTSPRALSAGDIIAWRSSSDSPPVLHRIVAITYEDGEPRFVTQGDQNRTADPEPIALQGPGDKVVYSVPYAGYVLNFARSAPGRAVLIAAPLLLLAALFLRNAPGSQRQDRRIGTEVTTAERQPSPALRVVSVADPQPVALDLRPRAGARSPSAQRAPRDLPAFLIRQLQLYRGSDLPRFEVGAESERAAA